MAGRIHQVLTFNAVPAGGQATLAHDIRWNSRPVIPDWIIPQQGNGAFTIVSTTTTQLTIQNDEAAPANFSFWLLSHHSITREFGNVATQFLSPLPFVLGGGGGGGSGAASNVVVWDLAKTWAAVYTEIQALTGPVICLVEFDPAGLKQRQMTAEGGGVSTDLWNVLFIGVNSVNDGTGASLRIVVDDGFVLGVNPASSTALLQSQNIDWEPDCTTTSWTAPGARVSVQLDYGRILPNPGPVFDQPTTFSARLRNAVGGLGANTVDSVGTTLTIRLFNNSTIAAGAFSDGTSATVDFDASSALPTPRTGIFTANGDLAVFNLFDQAFQVDYNDSTDNEGPFGPADVQAALDVLKNEGAFGATFVNGRARVWHGGGATILVTGIGAVIVVGTPVAAAIGIGSLRTSTARTTVNSAAGANSAAELRTGIDLCWRGDAARRGGFVLGMRISPSVVAPALIRGFFGLLGVTTAIIATQSPAALINCIGIMWESGETTLRIGHNDAAGACTRIDLGASFPVGPGNEDNIYAVVIWAQPNAATVNYWIRNETTGDIASGVLSTDLPADTQLFDVHYYINNGGTAAAGAFQIAQMVLATPT